MAEHVKIFEEKKSTPIWYWLLPLLLLLALLAFFLLRHHGSTDQAGPVPTQTAPAALPEIGMIHFATGAATLTPDGKTALDKAAAALKANPNAHLRIEGFTDATGTTAGNDVLSQQRAAAAADYLQTQGIDRSRLTGGGFGPQDPVATNATVPGRADNRRAELFLKP